MHPVATGTAGGADLLQLRHSGVMYLVEVDMVCSQVGEAGLDVRFHGLPVPGHGLGGQDELVPPALDGLPDELLTDRVAPGGVDVVDPGGEHRVQQGPCLRGADPLDGDAAKSQAGDLQSGPAKCNVLHVLFLL